MGFEVLLKKTVQLALDYFEVQQNHIQQAQQVDLD